MATNEAEEPWLDEGFADYSTARLIAGNGVDENAFAVERYGNAYLDRRRAQFLSDPGVPMLQEAWKFSQSRYVIGVYSKPTVSLLTLESVVGTEDMLRILRTYAERYRFSHPTTNDFRAIVEGIAGPQASWFFDGLMIGQQTLNYAVESVEAHAVTSPARGEVPIPVQVV